MPFADYENFDECVKKNKDKRDPEAYCAEIKRKIEKEVDWEYGLSFTKIGGNDSDVLYVAGEASNALKDHDNENMDMDSLKSAFVDYMKNPVIKFMHDKAPQHIGAIGLVVEKYIDSAGKLWETKFGKTPFLVAKFEKDTMPDWMWNAIQKRVYKGFSIGGKAFKKVKGTIYVKSWLETSVVDVPSAHGAFFTVLKMACIGEDCTIEKIKTPINSGKNLDRVEPYQETEEDKKRSSWRNMSEIIRFKEDFPQALFKDIQERFGWEEKYIKELLEKIDSVSDRYTQKNLQVSSFVKTINDYILDSFLKGGKGSGVKGHKTSKKERQNLLSKMENDKIKNLSDENMLKLLQQGEKLGFRVKKEKLTSSKLINQEVRMVRTKIRESLMTPKKKDDSTILRVDAEGQFIGRRPVDKFINSIDNFLKSRKGINKFIEAADEFLNKV